MQTKSQKHTLFHFLSSLILLLLSSNISSRNMILADDAELRALMELKSSLDPENKYLSSWTMDGHPCSGSYDGVACDEKGRVVNISLQDKGLAGKLSAAVAELKWLTAVYLHYNNLSGEIPKEIGSLPQLTQLYLNVNRFVGSIPSDIGSMTSLQVLELGCNQLNGSIPKEIGFLKNLNILALESNELSGPIPSSLGDLLMMKSINLSFNQLYGTIPISLANIFQLRELDVQNNTLSGVLPYDLRRLKEGFHFKNNPGLCGTGFSSLRACVAWDSIDSVSIGSSIPGLNETTSAAYSLVCNQTHCSMSSSELSRTGFVIGVILMTLVLVVAIFIGIVRKHKVANMSYASGDHGVNNDLDDHIHERSPSSLVSLDYDGWNGVCGHELVGGSKFSLEEVESATHHFSTVNLLGKSKFSTVYKGVLRDGSVVAIKCIRNTRWKTNLEEFVQGLRLLNSLKHENLVGLKGVCCSSARGECFLIYDFASKGNLSQYLEHCSVVLDWPTRVSVIIGIAKGLHYLHRSEKTKPAIIHQNISVEKVVMDQHYNPMILYSGLLKLLAEDVVFSAIKVSAALGYMPPEYVTTGQFTKKSDVYAFGVIIFQVISGKRKLPSSIRTSVELGKLDEFVDSKLDEFSETEVRWLAGIGLECTHELPEKRPTMELILEEWNEARCGG